MLNPSVAPRFGDAGDMCSAATARNAIKDAVWRLSVLGAKLAIILRREDIVAVIARASVSIRQRCTLLIVPGTLHACGIGELNAGDFLLKAILDVGFDLHAADSLLRLGRYACERDKLGECEA